MLLFFTYWHKKISSKSIIEYTLLKQPCINNVTNRHFYTIAFFFPEYDINAMILMSSLVFIDLNECIKNLEKLTESKKEEEAIVAKSLYIYFILHLCRIFLVYLTMRSYIICMNYR